MRPTSSCALIARETSSCSTARNGSAPGALSDRCQVLVVLGKTDRNASTHLQQSMVIVPRSTPGVSIGRSPQVFGYEDRGGHPEVMYDDVHVPVDNLLGELGGGVALPSPRRASARAGSITACGRSVLPNALSS